MSDEKQKLRAARLAALEEGCEVRAGLRTLSEVVTLARLQEEQESRLKEAASSSEKVRRPKPALAK